MDEDSMNSPDHMSNQDGESDMDPHR